MPENTHGRILGLSSVRSKVNPQPLSQLLQDVPATPPEALTTIVSGIAFRSDKVRPGDVFFCVPGFVHDGHEFAADAAGRGASALVVSHPVDVPGVPQVLVDDVRVALATGSARWYGLPSERLRVVGITGTNGKTTTTYLLDAIVRAAVLKTGIIGTVETRVGERRLPASRTTPESAELQELLAEMADDGVDVAIMEVSSHAIDLKRVEGVRFSVAAFTNLSQDHLDYHHTMEEYWSVKKRLFTEADVSETVVNVDDDYGSTLASEIGSTWTVGRLDAPQVRSEDEELGPVSSRFTLVTPRGTVPVTLPVPGDFNVSNALVAAGCALALGLDADTIARGLAAAPQVPGRLERVDAGQGFAVLVDYAHTPDGLEKAIAAVRDVTPGRVITVFGCGGDRDPEKRPLMGEVAGRLSDVAVVTSDNPRSEDPVGIILQVEDGLRQAGGAYRVVIDRRQAIASAIGEATDGDAVLIAGKGHEDYQIFADRTVHFDDREVAREELEAL
jgi:UDP-N-acetylmuramoyl-L-alanyl-D-glutamate--2,6-diaminopimelate ligase